MAKDPSKTEKPTPKKIQEARKKGSVAKSQDASMAVMLLAGFLMLRAQWPYFAEGLTSIMREYLGRFPVKDLSSLDCFTLFLDLTGRVLLLLSPLALTLLAVGMGINFVQVGRLWSWEILKPDLTKLNPLPGFQRFFSPRQAVETLKGIAKVGAILFVGYSVIRGRWADIASTIGMDPMTVARLWAEMAWDIILRSIWILIALGAFDLVYQRHEYTENLKMTKQEVQDEAKQQELPSEVKGKLKERQIMLARRRMMSEIPKASVVITNPTHLAIALKYEKGAEEVPLVVAKGADRLAEKIKEIAREARVPIVENKPVARALYGEVEVGEEIPKDLYQAVAEILVMVTKLNKRYAGR